MFFLSRKSLFLLILGIVIFVSSFIPLLKLNQEFPTQTYKTATDDGVQIIFDITKKSEITDDAPIAILLHGFSGNRKMMKHLAFSLADAGCISVSVDLRGHGDSSGVMDSSTKFDKDVESVIRALEQMNIGNTSKLILVGHSMGARVALDVSLKLDTVAAIIGIAPAVSPETINNTPPQRLLFILDEDDTIIPNDRVFETFYDTFNDTKTQIYDNPGIRTELIARDTNTSKTRGKLVVDNDSNHFTILYDYDVIWESTQWTLSTIYPDWQNLRGESIEFKFSSRLLNLTTGTTLIGGFFTIISVLMIVYDKINNKCKYQPISIDHKWRDFVRVGIQAVLLVGFAGTILTGLFTIILTRFTPLFITNSITAVFLGNSISLGWFAKWKLKSYQPSISFLEFVKQYINKNSIRYNISLGSLVTISFMMLLYKTIGNHLTLTFSIAPLRLLVLPFYVLLYMTIFFCYESFFTVIVRPKVQDEVRKTIIAPILELGVITSSILIQFIILGLFISQNIAFFLLGLGLILTFLALTVLFSDFFFKETGSWVTQILINAGLFATLTVSTSPIF